MIFPENQLTLAHTDTPKDMFGVSVFKVIRQWPLAYRLRRLW